MFLAASVALVALGVAVRVVQCDLLLSSNFHHTCIVDQSAALSCFGEGEGKSGQLGVGDWVSRSSLTLVAAPLLGVRVSSVDAGGFHTCAVAEVTGALFCFGYADKGQLGGNNTDRKLVPTLVAAPLQGVRVSTVSAGEYHTCAVSETNAQLFCFGAGSNGQLGYGGNGNQLVPTLVGGPLQGVRVSNVSAGFTHTCAITEAEAELYCFGRGASGELGHGSDGTLAGKLLPTPVAGPLKGQRVSAVSTGKYHTCAITEITASLYCFGLGNNGQLGTGDEERRKVPALVTGSLLGVRVSAVSAGHSHTCAITEESAALYCFGRSGYGQVGYGGKDKQLRPVLVAAPLMGVRVSAVSAGVEHTCAIAEANLYCFGRTFGLSPTIAGGMTMATTTSTRQEETTTTITTTSTERLATSTSTVTVVSEEVPTTTKSARSTVVLATGSSSWVVPVVGGAVALLVLLLCAMLLLLAVKRRRRSRRTHGGHVQRARQPAGLSRRASAKAMSRRPSAARMSVSSQQHGSEYGVVQLRQEQSPYEQFSTPLGTQHHYDNAAALASASKAEQQHYETTSTALAR